MTAQEPCQFTEPLQQVDRTYVRCQGRKLSYFGGCDYFRLSSHPRVLEAVRKGLATYGLNVAASRKTTGNHLIYERIERVAADYFGAERARLVSSGYLTNIVAAQALRGTIEHALVDERAHTSLRDATQFLGCRVSVFKHADYASAAKKFKPGLRTALLTDGLFSFNGTLAPIRAYRQALGAEVMLWIDDSHAAGIVGEKGQGSLEAAGLVRHNVLQTITFSKAFGVYGGAVLSDNATTLPASCVCVGNTPLPPLLAAGVLAALKLANREMRRKLRNNAALFWERLGARPPEPLTPIISLVAARPKAVRRALLGAGIYPSLIHYPGGPEQGYFRFALSSEHSADQIEALAKVLASAEVIG